MLKIDLSTIALILLLVVPGLCAKKGRRKISARSFELTGPATELGELVALSLAAHLLLLLVCALFIPAVSMIYFHSVTQLFRLFDQVDLAAWSYARKSEAIGISVLYVVMSVISGYWVGFVSGWLQLSHPILRLLELSPTFTKILHGLSIYSLLDEKPLAFELFTGEAISRRTDLIYFIELQLRDGKGFITGELIKYAVVKDEEQHRPIVLRDAHFKLAAEGVYEAMQGDRVQLDLADALLIQVSYQEREQALADIKEDKERL